MVSAANTHFKEIRICFASVTASVSIFHRRGYAFLHCTCKQWRTQTFRPTEPYNEIPPDPVWLGSEILCAS